MPKNMGLTDRRVRFALALVLVALILFVTEGTLDWVLGGLAVVLVATSSVGTCPAYIPFGIDTKPS